MSEQETKTEFDLAIEDLRELHLEWCYRNGGFPNLISTEIKGYLVMAGLDHDGEPELNIMKRSAFMKLWRGAKRLVACGDCEDMTEALLLGDGPSVF